MIAVDSSTFIAFIQDDSGGDVDFLMQKLSQGRVSLPPVVLTEILSDHTLSSEIAEQIQALDVLEATDGYWSRAGKTRAKLLRKKLKARLPDTLIAQSCIDHGVPLLTRDQDFRHFAKHVKLRIITEGKNEQ